MVDLQTVYFLIVTWQEVALLIWLSTVVPAFQVFVEISGELGFLVPLFGIAYMGAYANVFAIHGSVRHKSISLLSAYHRVKRIKKVLGLGKTRECAAEESQILCN